MPTPTESKDIPREGAEGASDASVDCSLILVKVSLPWVMAFLEILHLNLFNCTSLCFCDAPGPHASAGSLRSFNKSVTHPRRILMETRQKLGLKWDLAGGGILGLSAAVQCGKKPVVQLILRGCDQLTCTTVPIFTISRCFMNCADDFSTRSNDDVKKSHFMSESNRHHHRKYKDVCCLWCKLTP